MKKLLMIGAAAALGAAFADDAYIASTTNGTVYSINTGYKIKPTTGIYADFEFLARTADVFPNNTYQQFVWESTGGGVARFYINGPSGSGQLAWNFTADSIWSTSSQTMVPGTRYQMSVDAYTRTAWLDVAGVRKYSAGFAASSTVPNYTDTVKLFSNNSANGNAAMMKLYRFTITESGETVHDYIPAIKGGIVGMYDEVTGEFLYDVRNSPKAFEYGGDILELEDDPYVESDGTSFMNSRFFMNPDAKVEMDYALVGANAVQMRLFGADGTGVTFFSAYYINGSGNMSFGIGDEFKSWATSCAQNLYRHKAVLDVKNGKAYYITRFATNWTGNASGLGASITKTAKHPMGLFGDIGPTSGFSGECGLVAYNKVKAKVYGVKCWQNDVLVHDYVPHVKGGVAGFLDAVDGSFITGENPAAFTAGGKGIVVEEDDGYISTFGNNYNVGHRYINTGYTASANTRVELDYALADNYPSSDFINNHDWYLFEAAGSLRIDAYLNKDGMGWSGVDKNWHGLSVPLQTTQKDVRRTAIVDNTGWAAIITAGFTNRFATATPGSATYNSKPLRVAASADGAGFAPLKIYGLKIYESGNPVRNYKPYVTNGIAGLLDTVGSGGFVSSAIATNALKIVAGGNIEGNSGFTDAYIEGDGTQALSTGVTVKPGVCYEVDYQFTRVQGQARVFGTAQGTTANAELYVQGSADGSGTVAFGHGATWGTSGSASIAAGDLKRRKGVFDLTAKQWTLGEFSGSISDVAEGTSTYLIGLFAKGSDAAGTSFTQNPNFTPKYAHLRIYSFRIYEYVNGVKTLTHEFLPYKKGNVVGVYDTQTGEVKTNGIPSGNDFAICGKGVDGAERWIVRPQDVLLTRTDSAATLSANASGAIRYKWTKDGEAIEGGEDGDLPIQWHRRGGEDVYAVTAVYDVYGAEVEGEPVAATVKVNPDGMTVILR